MLSVSVGDVSHETIAELRQYCAMLLKWSQSINLIAASDTDRVWERHVVDSLQVAGVSGSVADIGTGAGFPGLMIAIIRRAQSEAPVILVESDSRKCAFLEAVKRELDLDVVIHNSRIEELAPMCCDTIVSRALGSISRVSLLAEPHLNANGNLVLMKGRSWYDEVRSAERDWTFQYQALKSNTDPEARIVRIWDLAPRSGYGTSHA